MWGSALLIDCLGCKKESEGLNDGCGRCLSLEDLGIWLVPVPCCPCLILGDNRAFKGSPKGNSLLQESRGMLSLLRLPW